MFPSTSIREGDDGKLQFHPWSRRFAILGCVTLLAVYFAGQTYWANRYNGQTATSWTTILSWNLTDFYLWTLFSPAVFWVCRKFHHEQFGRYGMLWRHLVCAILFSLIHSAITTITNTAFWTWQRHEPFLFWHSYYRTLVYRFQINAFLYSVLVGFWHAFDYHRRFQERRLKAAELEANLSHAHLLALKNQLQPHFLFNTLQAIAELVHVDIAAAETVTLELSELLRRTLKTGDTQQVSVADEIELLKSYLAIEQVRLKDRLSIQLEIAPETLLAEIPSLLLQPLVENAIRHGIAPFSGRGSVRIVSHRTNDLLRLEIIDSGPGLKEQTNGRPGAGIGLKNTRERLQRLYGERHRFELVNGRGLTVLVELPFKTAIIKPDVIHVE